MNFDKSDFRGMFFRIHGNSHLERCQNVPRLSTYKYVKDSDVPKEYLDQTKRWVIYMYDAGLANFWRERNMRMRERKELAARLAGFKEKDKEYLDTIFQSKNGYVLDMINDVLRVQNNRLWSEIMVNLNLFYEYQKELLDPILNYNTDKDLMSTLTLKSKLREELGTVRAHLDRLESEFYENDDELKLAATKRLVDPLSISEANV